MVGDRASNRRIGPSGNGSRRQIQVDLAEPTAQRPPTLAPEPPRRGRRATGWLLLAGLLLLAAIPLCVRLRGLPPLTLRESQAVAQTIETWRHYETRLAETGSVWFDRLTPMTGGEPRLNRPPGRVWLNLLAFETLDETATSAAELRFHARCVSVVAALLTVTGVFWAGFSIGGLLTAGFSGLVALALPAMIYQGRLATPAIAETMFFTLAIAGALWAIRPFRPGPSPWRQGIGWSLAGLALGMAVLTGGAVAFPAVLLPLVVMILLRPGRARHFMGLIAATLLAALAITPWVLRVQQAGGGDPLAWLGPVVGSSWPELNDYVSLVLTRFGLLLLAVLPWTLWVFAGLLQPLSKSSAGHRGRLFLGGGWFVAAATVVLVSPSHGRGEVIIPLLPVGGLVVGQLFRQFTALSGEGRHARLWRLLRWPQVLGLALASVALPALLLLQDELLREAYLSERLTAPIHWSYAAGMATVLLGLVALSVRYTIRHFPARALVCWAMWTVIATTLVLIPAADGPMLRTRVADDASPSATSPAAAFAHNRP